MPNEEANATDLTIPAAAARLEVSERTLRRLLSMARFDGRTVAIDRQTKKGCRRTATVPPDLLADLHAHIARLQEETNGGPDTAASSPADTAANGGTNTGNGGNNGGSFTGETSTATESVPVNGIAVESTQLRALTGWITQEADARIKEQAATIADLRRDKEEWQKRTLELESEVKELKAIAAKAAEPGAEEKDAQIKQLEDEVRELKAAARPWWKRMFGG